MSQSPRDLKSGLIRGDRESALNFLIDQKALDLVRSISTSYIVTSYIV